VARNAFAGAGPAPARAPRRRSFVGPLLLLSAGVLLLLNNLGLLPWSIWRELWTFWPLLLVLLGLEAFVTGRVAWGGLVLTILLVLVAGIALGASAFGNRWREATAPSGPPSATLRQPTEAATRASVRLDYGAGALTVASHDQPGLLATGELYGHRATGMDARYSVADGVGSLRLSPGAPGDGGSFGRLDVRLTPELPLDLRFSIGAADATLDLRELRVTSVRLETGASHVALLLPATGRPDVRIEGGAANIEVTVPDGMEARIVTAEGPSVVEVDESRFVRAGNEHKTAGFDGATNRATISLSVGAARVSVQ
jgi:hypothetical protein